MLPHLPVFIEKIYLGLLLAAPLGPVSFEMIKRGLTSGFWPSFSVRLGGGVANVLCLALTCFGLSYLVEYSLLVNTLGLGGVFLLFYLGYKTLTSKSQFNESSTSAGKESILSGLVLGFYLGIFNPVALAFWPGVFASSLRDVNQIGLSDFFENSFILIGILLWGAGLSFLSSLGKKFLSLNKLKLIAKVSGLLIIAYAFKSLYHMFDRIFL